MLDKKWLEIVKKEGIYKWCECEECGCNSILRLDEITMLRLCTKCLKKEINLYHSEEDTAQENVMGSCQFENNCDSETLHWGECPRCKNGIESLFWSWVSNKYICHDCMAKNKEIKLSENIGTTYKIAIDADSLIIKAISRHQPESGLEEDFEIEHAYFEFCQEIGKIKGAVFDLVEYSKGDNVEAVIVFSPKRTFRYDIYPEYKANRKDKFHMVGRKELMKLVMRRLSKWYKIVKNVEADDVVIHMAKNEGYMVSAIDKDILSVCPTPCYDYNNAKWHQPVSEAQAESWYCLQSLMGDNADNIKGAKGIGETGALRIMHGHDPKDKTIKVQKGMMFSNIGYHDIKHWFENEYEAMLNMRLVRMDQWTGEVDETGAGIINYWVPSGDLI